MSRKREREVNLEDHLPADQALLFSALREEFNAKMGSLKAWGIAALIGGQLVSGALAVYVGPVKAAETAAHAITALL